MDSIWVRKWRFDVEEVVTTSKGEQVVHYVCATVPGFRMQHFVDKGVWHPMKDKGRNR